MHVHRLLGTEKPWRQVEGKTMRFFTYAAEARWACRCVMHHTLRECLSDY